jgi:nucleoside-diphosphate-sugar epimerase
MNIFITGVSGYIGRRVAEKLQAAGHQIVGLARSDRAAQWMQKRGITPHRGDLFDAASMRQAALLADGGIALPLGRCLAHWPAPGSPSSTRVELPSTGIPV